MFLIFQYTSNGNFFWNTPYSCLNSSLWQVAKADIIVGDPSYFLPSMTQKVGTVVRSICLLDHSITGTDNAESVQIIIPAIQVRNLGSFSEFKNG